MTEREFTQIIELLAEIRDGLARIEAKLPKEERPEYRSCPDHFSCPPECGSGTQRHLGHLGAKP